MNKIASLLIFGVATLWGVEFHSYEDALKLQEKSKKVIMVDIMRTHCRYCEDMDKKVLRDPEFSKWLDARFISAKINLDDEKIPKGMRVDFTPTFYFVNHKGEILKRVPGSWTIQDFRDLTEKIK
jgi:thioredoxin-related protein